jgi:hypothetical protein
LRFRIVQVEDIDAIDAKVGHAAGYLILQETRSHAVAPSGDVLGGKNSALNIFLEKILIGIAGHFAVGRKIAGLGAEYQLIAGVAFGFQLQQGRADSTAATTAVAYAASVRSSGWPR